jgi:preprotein translocase subunit YajC
MSILNLLGISDAFAEATTTATSVMHGTEGSFVSMLLPLGIFIVVFYFLLIRPQTKKAKEHRKLVEALAKGDEVVTAGGIMGTVVDVTDNALVVEIAKDVVVRFQKSAVAMVLPKGSLKTE